jgi:hypothetical protein
VSETTDRDTRIAAARMRGWDKMQARVLAELAHQRSKPSTLYELPGYWGQDDPPKSEYEQLIGLCAMLLEWQEKMVDFSEQHLADAYNYGKPEQLNLLEWPDSALQIGAFVQGYRKSKIE